MVWADTTHVDMGLLWKAISCCLGSRNETCLSIPAHPVWKSIKDPVPAPKPSVGPNIGENCHDEHIVIQAMHQN